MTVDVEVDRDGRREITRRHELGTWDRYLQLVGWSYISPHFNGLRGGTRKGYLTLGFWPRVLRFLGFTANVERNYPCGCWQSWALWQVGPHRFRLMFGNHDDDAEAFRRARKAMTVDD